MPINYGSKIYAEQGGTVSTGKGRKYCNGEKTSKEGNFLPPFAVFTSFIPLLIKGDNLFLYLIN